MEETFDLEQAKTAVEGGLEKAQEILGDPEKMNELLGQLETKVKELPSTLGDTLSQIPLMASMVKSYVTKEYTEVSPKVVASVVSAFLYLVSKKDLIRDDIPVLGYVDDVAVIAFALKLNEQELADYKLWRDTNTQNV